MRTFLIFIQFLIIVFVHQQLIAQRIGHYDEDWKIIKTEHFDVVVNEKQLDLGRYYALAAEKAYSNLSTVFETLTERVVIIVNDTTDVTNGYATRIPYPHVMAYAVVAGDHDSLSEVGDWPQILMTHELTHILQFEPATGIYSILRPIFGNIVAPNMLMPAWWKEGMAVELETQFSTTGRSRSTFQSATMRSIVLENKLGLYDLAQSNEVLPSWPYGARPYLFGSLFFNRLVTETNDIKSINHLAKRQGERLPYFVEEPMNELKMTSYEAVYDKALASVQENSLKEAETLKKNPLTEINILDENAQANYRPSISNHHKLVAYLESAKDRTKLIVRTFEGVKLDLKKAPIGDITNIQFHPKLKKILYSKIEKVDSAYLFSDLYEYDIDAEKSTRLTFSQRSRNPSYSEDGNRIVFLTPFSGQTQIRVMQIYSKQTQFILNSGMDSRYESPIFWNDQTILAAKINSDGKFSLVKIDIKTQKESAVSLEYKHIRFLKKYKNSLYFVSSQNGINNIYRSEDLATATPVTNVLTGIWSYDLADNSNGNTPLIWGSIMTGSGFKVAKLVTSKISEPLPVIVNAASENYKYKNQEYTAKPFKTEDYSAGSYLWPSYWIPFVSTSSSSKGVYLQAQTTGQDPLLKHTYNLVASYDSELNKGNFNGAYINSTQKLPLKLTAGVKSFALGTYLNIVENTTYAASVLPDLFALDKSLGFEIGGQLQNNFFINRTQHYGPYLQLNYVDFSQSIFDISPTSGWAGIIKYEHLFKQHEEVIGTAQDFDRAQFSLLAFYSDILPKNHAIKARLSGLASSLQNDSGRYGSNSSSQFYDNEGLSPQYVVRGYPATQFFGGNIWNTNFEYRFPVSTVETGSGTDPYYFKRISGAFVTDGLGVDGYGLAEDLTFIPLKSNQSFWSSGLELKLESTIGYILPMNFVLGYYYPYSPQFSSSAQIGVSLQIGNL